MPNRIVLAPLTRTRAHPDTRVPSDLAVEYYRQRAGAGLIISEATSVTPMGVGYAGTPGIWSDEQTEGWKKVTEAVHGAGGRMLLQLWHVGRISDPIFLNGATAGCAQRHPAQGPCLAGAAGKGLMSRRARSRRKKFPASSPPTNKGARECQGRRL